MRFRHMTSSKMLADLISANTNNDDTKYCLSDCCDMTSTSGYDNDGSTGPELLDNGIALALKAKKYDADAIIFYAIVGDTAYYQFGKDEADACARLTQALDE